jgi:3-hydroxy acid dehydrogenase / malonic semialdehyde reductase
VTSPNTATAIITGASSGIGLAIAQTLLQQQYQVIGIARDFTRHAIDDPRFSYFQQDLAELKPTSDLIKSICKTQNVDIFIHCAGEGLFGSIEQFSVAQIDRNIRLNLTSALVLSHHLVPHMRKLDHAHIILIGSESALQAGKKGALYSSAKFGLRGLAQSLREDCARDGIRVTLINPGMVDTAFFDQQDFRPGKDPSNAIQALDIADCVSHVLNSNSNLVYDEINLTPRNKSIDFSPSSKAKSRIIKPVK